jgi:hypothetical protein
MSGPYNKRDYAIMANKVFHYLCDLDQEDRENNREPKWQDIVEVAATAVIYDNRIDAAYLAETTVLDELRYIERSQDNINIRLTPLGRENCSKEIDIQQP